MNIIERKELPHLCSSCCDIGYSINLIYQAFQPESFYSDNASNISLPTYGPSVQDTDGFLPLVSGPSVHRFHFLDL